MKSRHECHFGAAGRAIDYAKNAGFAQKLADASITLVSDEAGILDKIRSGALDLKKLKNIFLVEAKFSAITQVEDVEENSALFSMIEKELSGTAVKLTHEKFDVKIEPARALELFEKLAGAGLRESLAIVVTYNAHIFKGQNELAAMVTGNAAYSIAAAVRNPYDLMTPGAKTCKIATYGFRRSNMRSLFNAIFSGSKPPGILPVKFK
jgi:hypothetical protein